MAEWVYGGSIIAGYSWQEWDLSQDGELPTWFMLIPGNTLADRSFCWFSLRSPTFTLTVDPQSVMLAPGEATIIRNPTLERCAPGFYKPSLLITRRVTAPFAVYLYRYE